MFEGNEFAVRVILFLALILFSVLVAFIIVQRARRKTLYQKVVNDLTSAELYYYNGNPGLGMGPPHPDGHGNHCDCWNCWSQYNSPPYE